MIVIYLSPYTAFHLIHGGPLKIVRTHHDYGPNAWWGEARSSNEIWIYKSTEASDIINSPRFIIHETGHTFENAVRNTIKVHIRTFIEEGLYWRNYPEEAYGGFYAGDSAHGGWQWSYKEGGYDDGGTPAIWNEEKQRYDNTEDDKDGRGEIFADMFLGWVYNKWEVNPDNPGTWSQKGQERADFMDSKMPNWVFRVINKRRPYRR